MHTFAVQALQHYLIDVYASLGLDSLKQIAYKGQEEDNRISIWNNRVTAVLTLGQLRRCHLISLPPTLGTDISKAPFVCGCLLTVVTLSWLTE